MDNERSAYREAHCESLDVAFWLHPDRLARSTSRADMGGHMGGLYSDGGAMASAQRAGELIHVVASALGEIPFSAADAIEIRRITDLELEKDAPLGAPLEVRARAIGTRELAAGRRLVTIWCQLTNQFGDRVVTLAVEIEAKASAVWRGRTADVVASPEPDLECVDNIPV